MNGKLKRQRTIYAILSVLLGLAGLYCAVYLWNVLGDRGLYADATHTGGYTTGFDVILMVLTVILVVGSVVCFFRVLKLKDKI